ncbi:MAG: DUF3604 domain-containing protein [Pseudomonadales bacterium]
MLGKLKSFFLLTLMLTTGAPPYAAESDREVYFGETHMHTSWSIDAYAISGGTYNGPAEAYRYARGETINHPLGYPVRISKPLDWIGVTEHAGYMGAFLLASDPDSILHERHPVWAKALDIGAGVEPLAAYMLLAKSVVNQRPIEAFRDPEVLRTLWSRLVAIADEYYEPGVLTTFPAYEWTAQPGNKNMHRNIFFRDSKKVPDLILDAIESGDPVDLWAWMDRQREAGNDLLAISHNGNLSDGLMFPTDADLKGRPIDAAWAASRLRNEPLTEIKQGKGTSETTPLLSPNDEFAGYELLEWKLLGETGVPRQHGSYVRHAYRDGLTLQGISGFNPYKFGLVAGSDSHNAATGYRQDNWFGMHGSMDGTPEMRLSAVKQMNLDNRQLSPPGLSAVWAEENSRDAIFDALKRRETYATSGVRIRLRFFGGWAFTPALLDETGWVGRAYAEGAVMGGDLPPEPASAPVFVVHAVKDPDSGNLDRIQIVKGWSDRGQSFEKIFDVAWSGDRALDPNTQRIGPVGNTVNFSDATYANTIGAAELKVVWTDPAFDPSLDAFYYVRVLEIPTPRWTLIQSRAQGQMPPEGIPLTTQERAWSSPIWYTPSESARSRREPGTTVADLLARGARRLDDAALTEFAVGNTLRVENTVSERRYDLFYGKDGRRLVTGLESEAPEDGRLGNVVHTFAAGATASYVIRDGRLITDVGGQSVDIEVYELDGRYHAARGNEFGYANYRVERVEER